MHSYLKFGLKIILKVAFIVFVVDVFCVFYLNLFDLNAIKLIESK